MTDATAELTDAADADGGSDGNDAPKKKGLGLVGILLIVLLALVAAGGGFAVSSMGLIGGGGHADGGDGDAGDGAAEGDAHADDHGDAHADAGPGTDAVFVSMPPTTVSIGSGGRDRQLRMKLILESDGAHSLEVEGMMPRLQDAMLSYMRAIDPSLLEDPAALLRLRAQMLRRARLVAGEDAVANLLIVDFVLN